MHNFNEKSVLNQQLRQEKNIAEQAPFIFVAAPDFASATIFDIAVVPDRDTNPVFKHLTDVVIAIANAGYEGVDIVESPHSNGRIFSAVSIKPDTPAGHVLEYVKSAADFGVFIPPEVVLEAIKVSYAKGGQS
jgi:hypothetical protein